MVVYIEYAFTWNFFLDALLLWLSLRACKRKIKWYLLLVAALIGGIFAIVFPLLSLPAFWTSLLKIATGMLLCLIAFGRIKGKKAWGKYAMNCIFFFSFTFAFGGGIIAISGENVSKGVILLFFALLTALSLFLIERLYRKRAVEGHTYPCSVSYKQKRIRLLGFYDSGNLAALGGLPVCFLSVDVFYDLWGEEIAVGGAETEGQVCVEINFQTLGGEKKTKGYLGELEIVIKQGKGEEKVKKQVYFCPSSNMLRREYKLLLNARIFD